MGNLEQVVSEHECRVPDAPVDVFEEYVHLLRVAAEGGGIAIGRNGCLNDYVVDGRLVAVRDTWLRTGLAVYAIPTASGKQKPALDRCLEELAKLVAQLCAPTPATMANEPARKEPLAASVT